MTKELLKIEGLSTYFTSSKGFLKGKQTLKAVDDVSFSIYEGETFGLVGESGCGKSTLGRTIVKLLEPVKGRMTFDGKDITSLKGAELQQFKRDVQMIFQDPYASLNPRMTVGEIIGEPLVIHGMITDKKKLHEKVCELLETVGLKPDHIRRYPHEFSGGQRQRISIARTLALNPRFIVCDEPISALDVSIQAQIINLLEDIQKRLGISYLFIAHDLGIVKHISHRIGVMYLGNLVELGEADDLYHHPLHPYSKGLLASAPIPDPDTEMQKEEQEILGELPSPLNRPVGCPFRTRCPHAMEVCEKEMPTMQQVEQRLVACHLYR